MDRDPKTATYAGLLFLVTIVFSIPAVGIYARIRTDPNYVVGAGQDARPFVDNRARLSAARRGLSQVLRSKSPVAPNLAGACPGCLSTTNFLAMGLARH